MNSVQSKRKIRIFLIILCLFFMMIGAVALRYRGGYVVSAKEDVIPASEIVMYRQDDERWQISYRQSPDVRFG